MKHIIISSILSLGVLSSACNTSPGETTEIADAAPVQVAETITLSISGMDCDGCVKSVTEALKGVDGVAEVEVSLENHTAVIKGSNVDLFRLTAALDSAGYGATPVDPNAQPTATDSTKSAEQSKHGDGQHN